MATPIFLANPDSYGRFGHQTMRMLCAVLLARLTRGQFVPIKYTYFSSHYNSCVDYSHSSLSKKHFKGKTSIHELKGLAPDMVGNTKYDLMQPHQLGHIIQDINIITCNSSDDYVIIRLPFDQPPGRLLSLCRTLGVDELGQHMFHFRNMPNPVLETAADPFVIVHVRRGDVNQQNHPEWFIDDAVYVIIISILNSILPSAYQIVLVGQGELQFAMTSELSVLQENGRLRVISSEVSFRTSNEAQIFNLMLRARMIIGGLSSFSYIPSLIAKAPFVCLSNNGQKPREWPQSTYKMISVEDNSINIKTAEYLLGAALSSESILL